jgi:signal transduction histidine kinase/ligand-binding sensor domain-containing protein
MIIMRAPFRIRILVFGASCVWLLFSPISLAIDPTETLTELHQTRWTVREGLPPDLSVITQTTDGFLWLATTSGLYRFDGDRFDLPTLGTGAPITEAVSALLALPGNGLLVGMRFGGAFLIRDGRVTHYGKDEGLPARSVTAFALRDDGSLWAQTTAGLYRLNGSVWKPVASDWNYPAKIGFSLIVAKDGTLWSHSGQGTFSLARNATSFNQSSVPGTGRGNLMTCAAGELWVSDNQQGLMVLSDRVHSIEKSALGGGDPATGSVFCDREGGLWTYVEVNEQQLRLIRIPDVAKFVSEDYRIAPEDQPTSNTTQSIAAVDPALSTLEDKEGNVWISSGDALARFRSNKMHSALESMPMRGPAIAVSKGGDIYLADDSAIVKIPSGQRPQLFMTPVHHNSVNSLWLDADDSIWVGYTSDLDHYVRGHLAKVLPLPGPNHLGMNAIIRSSAGFLWVASIGNGLYRLDETGWALNGGLAELPRAVPSSLTIDSIGRLWAGYADNRIAIIEQNQVHLLPNTNDLQTGPIFAIAANDDRVWVAQTQNVFLYLGNHFWPLSTSTGSGIRGVTGIAESADGALWLSGIAGVTHISADDVKAFAADHSHHVNTETFNYEDGLNGAAPALTRLPSLRKSPDGRIWVITSGGVYWIDPTKIPRNMLPPPVLVTSIRSGGKEYLTPGEAKLPTKTGDFEIDYTALSLSIPSRVKFKYKLDGVDSGWQDAGARRQAFYTNVPPGSHPFRVIAANEDGVWNETGASVAVTIPPAFYQTRWFLALCCLAFLGLLWELYRLRMRQLQGRLSVRLRERERIARELHDTLIQSAQGLILIFQGFAGQFQKPDPMRRKMETALDQADHLLNEARARVTELRTSGIDDDIVKALTRAGTEIFADGAVQFIIVATGTARAVSQPIGDEIYRIGREAITNAATHSGAKAVEVEVAFDAAQFKLRIRDDGCGISPQILNAGSRPQHFGLQGMRERAQRIGAELTLSSREGAGTELELLVPSAVAYRETAKVPRRVVAAFRRWRQRPTV